MIWRLFFRAWSGWLNPTKMIFSDHVLVRYVAFRWVPWWGKVGFWLDDKASQITITGDGSGEALPPIDEGFGPLRTWNPSGGAGASTASSSDATGAEVSNTETVPKEDA